MPLEGGPDVILGRVEALDDRGHGVGKAGALQALVVVVGMGEEGPQRPGLEQVATGQADGGRGIDGCLGGALWRRRRVGRLSHSRAHCGCHCHRIAADEVEMQVGEAEADGGDDYQRHGAVGGGHQDEADEEVGDRGATEDEAHVQGDADRRQHAARDH